VSENVKDLDKDAAEYLCGAEQEIYEIKLSPKYAGMSFVDAGIYIRRNFGAVLFAVGLTSPDDPLQVLINPVNHIFTGNEHAFILTKGLTFLHRFRDCKPRGTNATDNETVDRFRVNITNSYRCPTSC
jgi:Calcium-activated BK potassium channel alpha subunit